MVLISYSISIATGYRDQITVAQSQGSRLPPLQSLPPEQNPFRPVAEVGIGEIDTSFKDGSRLSVYISAPARTGSVTLLIYPEFLGDDYFGKSFDFSLRGSI